MDVFHVLTIAFLDYLSYFISAIVAIIFQQVVKLVIFILRTAWPERIETPFGERYRSSEPVIPPQGGLLFPFIQTSKALEMLEEKKRAIYTLIGLSWLALFLLLIRAFIREQEFLIILGNVLTWFYNALRPILDPIFNPIIGSLASIGVYFDPIIMATLFLLAILGTLIREAIG